MDRAKKASQIDMLEGVFAEAGSVVVAHYTGMTVADLTKLRTQMRAAGAKFKVAKNRLAKRALDAKGAGAVAHLFTGPTGIAYAADPMAAPKVASAFAKENDKFTLVGGFMGEEVLDQNAVKALATLPSLDELRGKLIGLLQAPATKVAGVVQAPAAQLARVFNAYATKDAA